MTQFSLIETAGRRVSRLILAGIGLCIATPAVTLIPIVAILDPLPGRDPASTWWVVVGGMAAAIGIACLVLVIVRLWRLALAVRMTADGDLVLEGLYATNSLSIGDITALAEGPESDRESTLIIEHRDRIVSVTGDADTLQRIADAIGRHNPYVALGPWTRLVDTGRDAGGLGGDEQADFLFLSGHRVGWRLQTAGTVVMALTVGVTAIAFYDKLGDALAGASGAPWKKVLAQLAGVLGTLSAISVGFGMPVLAAVVGADGSVRFARLWSTVTTSVAEITGIREPERAKKPQLTVKYSGGEVGISGDRDQLEGLVSALQRLNPQIELGPWRHLFAEDTTQVDK